MTTCVVSFENRDLEYRDLFRKNHREFCERHGYAYVCLDTYSETIPPYWVKAFLVRDLLPSYDWVVWIDSDAVFESTAPLPLDEATFFISGRDKPQHTMPAQINVGVFAVRRCPVGLTFMEMWVSLYNPSRWKLRRNGTWKCLGKWAGDDYEQGSCISLLRDPMFSSHKIHPWYVFNNHPGSGHVGIAYHFCGSVGKRMLSTYLSQGS